MPPPPAPAPKSFDFASSPVESAYPKPVTLGKQSRQAQTWNRVKTLREKEAEAASISKKRYIPFKAAPDKVTTISFPAAMPAEVRGQILADARKHVGKEANLDAFKAEVNARVEEHYRPEKTINTLEEQAAELNKQDELAGQKLRAQKREARERARIDAEAEKNGPTKENLTQEDIDAAREKFYEKGGFGKTSDTVTLASGEKVRIADMQAAGMSPEKGSTTAKQSRELTLSSNTQNDAVTQAATELLGLRGHKGQDAADMQSLFSKSKFKPGTAYADEPEIAAALQEAGFNPKYAKTVLKHIKYIPAEARDEMHALAGTTAKDTGRLFPLAADFLTGFDQALQDGRPISPTVQRLGQLYAKGYFGDRPVGPVYDSEGNPLENTFARNVWLNNRNTPARETIERKNLITGRTERVVRPSTTPRYVDAPQYGMAGLGTGLAALLFGGQEAKGKNPDPEAAAREKLERARELFMRQQADLQKRSKPPTGPYEYDPTRDPPEKLEQLLRLEEQANSKLSASPQKLETPQTSVEHVSSYTPRANVPEPRINKILAPARNSTPQLPLGVTMEDIIEDRPGTVILSPEQAKERGNRQRARLLQAQRLAYETTGLGKTNAAMQQGVDIGTMSFPKGATKAITAIGNASRGNFYVNSGLAPATEFVKDPSLENAGKAVLGAGLSYLVHKGAPNVKQYAHEAPTVVDQPTTLGEAVRAIPETVRPESWQSFGTNTAFMLPVAAEIYTSEKNRRAQATVTSLSSKPKYTIESLGLSSLSPEMQKKHQELIDYLNNL